MSLFEELVQIMAHLRAEDGCPWDREQDHKSLRPYLVEEAYEVLDALDRDDDRDLREELGDLMLQIVFHAQIAREENRFDIEDVLRTHIHKLKRRHPHVFGDTTVSGPDQVVANWEEIKRREGKRSVLDGVPRHLPALLRAYRVQEKAAGTGFDWEDVEGAFSKVEEELKEFRDACARQDTGQVEEELGDLLFSLVNVARFMGIYPEDALRKTVDKFIRRFRFIESQIERTGRRLDTASIEEMDALWEQAKADE